MAFCRIQLYDLYCVDPCLEVSATVHLCEGADSDCTNKPRILSLESGSLITNVGRRKQVRPLCCDLMRLFTDQLTWSVLDARSMPKMCAPGQGVHEAPTSMQQRWKCVLRRPAAFCVHLECDSGRDDFGLWQ